MPQQSPNIQGERLLPNSNIDLSGGTVRALVLSGGTIYSGATDLGLVISSIVSSGGAATVVQPGTNITTGGTAAAPTINVVASPSFTNLSASTVYSGSTNLSTIITNLIPAASVTLVQPGLNITTGGTSLFPIVNVISNPIFASVSANTVTGTTVFTDFVTGSDNSAKIGGTANAYTGTKFNSAFIGGASNTINSGFLSNIIGGANNLIISKSQEAIINGNANIITANTASLFIQNTTIGGTNARIFDSVSSTVIGGTNVLLSGGNNTTAIGVSNFTGNTANTVFVPNLQTTGNISGTTLYSGNTNLGTLISRQNISSVTQSFGIQTITLNDLSSFILTGGSTTMTLANDLTSISAQTSATTTAFTFSLESNTTYLINGMFRTSCTGSGGLKYMFFGPNGATVNVLFFGNSSSVTAFVTVPLIIMSGLTGTGTNTGSLSNAFAQITGQLTTSAAGIYSIMFNSGIGGQTSTLFKVGTTFSITKLR